MAPQAATQMEVTEVEHYDQQVTDFATALTALSAQHGIGITGAPVLFTMEREDYERSYRVSDASGLIFE